MSDSRVACLAALLDDMPTEQAQAWVDGDAAPAAEWLVARGVQYAPRERGSDSPHDTETLGDFWRGDVKLTDDERDWVRTALDVLEREVGSPVPAAPSPDPIEERFACATQCDELAARFENGESPKHPLTIAGLLRNAARILRGAAQGLGEPPEPAPVRPRIPYGSELAEHRRKPVGTCHDCGVRVGELHKEGCDWEECETCGAQRIGCSCCVVCRAHEKDGTWCVCGNCIDLAKQARRVRAAPREPSPEALRAALDIWAPGADYDFTVVAAAIRAAYAVDGMGEPK